VVLQGNQWQGKANVAVEPELQWDPQSTARLGGWTPLLQAAWVVVLTTEATTNHLLVATALASGDRQIIPDLKPVTELTVDALTTNFNINTLDQVVTKIIDPTERATVSLDTGKLDLNVSLPDKITVTGNRSRDLAAKITNTVECLLDRLNGEVSVATVHYLKIRDLGLAREIDILGAVGDKLH